MALLDDLKKRADANGDGKLTKADLDSFNTPENKQKIDELKKTADRNGDGKVDFSDAKGLDLGQLAKDAKNLFGK